MEVIILLLACFKRVAPGEGGCARCDRWAIKSRYSARSGNPNSVRPTAPARRGAWMADSVYAGVGSEGDPHPQVIANRLVRDGIADAAGDRACVEDRRAGHGQGCAVVVPEVRGGRVERRALRQVVDVADGELVRLRLRREEVKREVVAPQAGALASLAMGVEVESSMGWPARCMSAS
jgi:hypothetical protein